MAAGRVPKRADWRVADGVRVEELDGSWLALDPAGGIVYRLEARAAEVMRLVAHRLPLPGHLVPAARELAGHGVLEHPFVDRRTALVGAGVVTLTGLAATMLPSASSAASTLNVPNSASWPASSDPSTFSTEGVYYFHAFTNAYLFPQDARTLTVRNTRAITDVSLLIVGGGGGGGGRGVGGGGGGGAGQLLLITGGALPEPSGRTSYDMRIRIGAGGFGASSPGAGQSGADTTVEFLNGGETLLTFTAKGGGGGGAATGAVSTLAGLTGGSAGGSGAGIAENATTAGTDAGTGGSSESDLVASFPNPAVRERRAFGGGAGTSNEVSASARAGGGGGANGAGGAGGTGTLQAGAAGDGGAALYVPEFASFGSSNAAQPQQEETPGGYFAGGGGGAAGKFSGNGQFGQGGGGGAGIGGAGSGTTGQSAKNNTGSGGGGGSSDTGGFGGSGGHGVVLIRYKVA